MTATPIATIGCGYEFTAGAFVIQWHILGMYGPSFVSGGLIARFGLPTMLLTCCGINLAGIAESNFWAANVLLGWNFLFIGATTLWLRFGAPAPRRNTLANNGNTVGAVAYETRFWHVLAA